jgi:hypothetical protein
VGIIREQDRRERQEFLEAERREKQDCIERMLADLKARLPSIVEKITESARCNLVKDENGRVKGAIANLPSRMWLAKGNLRAQELIKNALLEIEPNTDKVEVKGEKIPDTGLRVWVTFDPPLS